MGCEFPSTQSTRVSRQTHVARDPLLDDPWKPARQPVVQHAYWDCLCDDARLDGCCGHHWTKPYNERDRYGLNNACPSCGTDLFRAILRWRRCGCTV